MGSNVFDHTSTFKKAKAIVTRLVEAGYPSYFVGGVVRDMLMKRPPSDIDIATAASPETVSRLFERTIQVGRGFGVVLVVEEGDTFEVATFRAEGPYKDGRRPDWVSYTDARADVTRRDFTLNGLLYDPLAEELIDWVSGRKDIDRKLVRAIGEPRQRFEEDKLRLLRAIRLASNLGFEVEEGTGEAIREMAGQIQVVSAERIRQELVKMFTEAHADRGLLLLDQYQLLKPLLPEIERMKGVEQGDHHPEGDVFTHTVKILSFLSKPTQSLAFAALLHDVGKPPTFQPGGGPPLFPNHPKVGAEMARDIMNRLRFDRRTRDLVVDAVTVHLQFLDVQQMRPATLRRFIYRDNFTEELELHRLDCLAGNGDLTHWNFVKEKIEELEREPLPAFPLLRGTDLIDAGFQQGRQIGRILKEVEEKRLEGSLKSHQEAKSWVLDHYSPDTEE
jgi:poly(A) polymerase